MSTGLSTQEELMHNHGLLEIGDDGAVFSDYPQSDPAQTNSVNNALYQDLENAIRERDENMGKSNKIILAQETELFELRNKLKAAKRDIQVLRAREEAFMDGSSSLTALKADREDMESKLELLQATNAVLKGEKSQLAQKINLMEIDAQRLRDSLKSMQENDELTKKEIQLALAKSSVASTTEDEMKALQWDLQNETEKNATVMRRLELEKQNVEVEKQRTKDLERELEEGKAKLRDTMRDLEDERMRAKDLKHQLDEARKSGTVLSKETFESLGRELQEAKAERDQLVGQNQSLANRTRNLLRDVEDERSGRLEAEGMVEKLQREADSRQGIWPLEAMEKLQLAEDEGRKHKNENIELMQQVAKLERENLLYANRESKFATVEESLSVARKAAEEEKRALEGALARSRDAEERASKDREAAMQACDALMVAEERIASLMGEVQELSAKKDQWEMAQEKVMRVLERNLDIVEGAVGSVGEYLVDGNAKTQSLQAQMGEMQKDLDHWRQLMSKKVQDERGLKEELEGVQEEAGQLEKVQGQLSEKEKEAEKQREQLEAARKQLEGARKEARDVRGDGEGRMLSVLEKMRDMSSTVWKGETAQSEAIGALDEVVDGVGQALESLHKKVTHWRAVRELGGKEVEVLRDELAGKEEELGKLRIERVKDVQEMGALRERLAKGEREAEKRQTAHAKELGTAKEMLAMKEEQQTKQEEIDSRKLADLREKLARNEGELSRLQREQELERQSLEASQKGLSARTLEHELALDRLNTSEQELTQLKKEHDHAREKLAETWQEMRKLRRDHEHTQEKLVMSEQQVANLRREREREQEFARQIEPKEVRVETKPPPPAKHEEQQEGTACSSGAEEAEEEVPQRRVVKTSPVAPVAKMPGTEGREKLADAVPSEEARGWSGRQLSVRWREDVAPVDDEVVVDPSTPETGHERHAHRLERFDAQAASLLNGIWGAEPGSARATSDALPVSSDTDVRRHSVDTASPAYARQRPRGGGERPLQQWMPAQRGLGHSPTTTIPMQPGIASERGRPDDRQSYSPTTALPIGLEPATPARRSLSSDLAAQSLRTAASPALKAGPPSTRATAPEASELVGSTDQLRGTPREVEITPRETSSPPAFAYSVSKAREDSPPPAKPTPTTSPQRSNAATVPHARMEGEMLPGAARRASPPSYAASPSAHASSSALLSPTRLASSASSAGGGAEFEVVPLKRVGRPARGGATTPDTATPRARVNLGEVLVESLGLVVLKGDAGLGGADMVVVSEVVRGGPAALTEQVREGDVVLAVDGNWLSGLSLTRAAGKMEGETGGQVTLSMLRSVPGMAPASFMVHVIRGGGSPPPKASAQKSPVESVARGYSPLVAAGTTQPTTRTTSPPETHGSAAAGGREAARDSAATALYGLVIDDSSTNLKPQRMEDEDEAEVSEEEWDA
eukprot:CAMPEP_0181347052 /NCGR_PEP_ID=MMETSP1101-20121128/33670_1 /TAXON_ID=46948 /ORGANISM="Rhodomonas abbreviata, Strain Caron Lab Isolate" /LENGTH=1434 /DNA_ID=CAMNT_0023459235 /DNA_START=195 /DNA_END=4500 /DNA_ORIENTATION=-